MAEEITPAEGGSVGTATEDVQYISQVQLKNGSQYTIKDSGARNSINTLNTKLNSVQSQINNNTEVTEVTDTSPYLYKLSEHDAVYDEIVGGSVAWNQTISKTTATGSSDGVTFTNNGDGSWTLTGTPTEQNCFYNLNYTANTLRYLPNHVYFVGCDCNNSKVGLAIVGQNIVGFNHRYIYGSSSIVKTSDFTVTSNTSTWCRFQIDSNGVDIGTVKMYPFVTDLTLMFGSTIADYIYSLEQATAGSGIEWLKSYGFFTEDYYAYNTGELMSVNTSGKKVVGKNLLEITANSEVINGVTFTVSGDGTITANGTASATTFYGNKIALKADTDYVLSGCPSGGGLNSYRCDVRRSGINGEVINNAIDTGSGSVTFQIPTQSVNNAYFCIRIYSGYTCNNLVFKPMIRRADVTDSIFEPYTSITYPIQSTDLRGLYKLNGNRLYTDGDIYSADGTVTRKYGIVDLGTLEWYAVNNCFYASVPSMKQPINSVAFNAINSKYIVKTWDSWYSNKIDGTCGFGNDGAMYISNSSYTDAATFKTAMSGVHLIYELATPTTETARPFASPQIVYRNGTEEYLDIRDVPIPVGGNRKYIDIPDWMTNKYFDDLRSVSDKLAKELHYLTSNDLAIGLKVDYENKTFERLGAAKGLSAGADFNKFHMFKERKRVGVQRNGAIDEIGSTAEAITNDQLNDIQDPSGGWYDIDYGVVMVKQPKFYYKVVPLKLEAQTGNGTGYHMRSAEYWISEVPLPGYKIHPAFLNENGEEVDYYLTGAYESALYDISANKVIRDDSQVADLSTDVVVSLPYAKPISGLHSDLILENLEKMSRRLGEGWHNTTIQIESAEQLLMMIEYGSMNLQDTLGQGVVNIPDNKSYNCSATTGATVDLGNNSGRASSTSVLTDTTTSYTDADKTSVSYRGRENPYGNIWQAIWLILISGNGSQNGGIPYIFDLSYFPNSYHLSSIDGATSAGFTVPNTAGFISAVGYGNADLDWLIMTSETGGNSALPVGDDIFLRSNLNGLSIARLGGRWNSDLRAGPFFWDVHNDMTSHNRTVGGRLAKWPIATISETE